MTTRHETLVDVGIPTFGEPKFLREAIESVFAQTVRSWALTISENGPGSDYVKGVLEPYLSDPRVRYVTTGSNLGGAGNSTNLLRQGDHAYVALLHDDDRWEPEFLERRVHFLQANPTCGLVFSCCDFIDERGGVVHHFAPRFREGLQPRARFLRTLYRRNVICIPTVLVPRWCYEAVGAAFNERVLYYDYEMWLRIASRSDVGFLKVTDAGYRIHPAQTTHAVDAHVGDHRLALLDAVDTALPAGFSSLERRRARSGALLRAAMDILEQGDRQEAAAHLRAALRQYPFGLLDPRMLTMAVGSIRRRSVLRRTWG